jgi:hydrogenase maturation protease
MEIDSGAPASLDEPRAHVAADVATHGMNPMRVLQLAQAMGGVTARILRVGCEPETLGSDEEGLMGLSEAVAAAVEPAADIVEALVGTTKEESRVAA